MLREEIDQVRRIAEQVVEKAMVDSVNKQIAELHAKIKAIEVAMLKRVEKQK